MTPQPRRGGNACDYEPLFGEANRFLIKVQRFVRCEAPDTSRLLNSDKQHSPHQTVIARASFPAPRRLAIGLGK